MLKHCQNKKLNDVAKVDFANCLKPVTNYKRRHYCSKNYTSTKNKE